MTIHQEASKIYILTLLKSKSGAKVGIALSPGTPLDSLEYVIEDADNIILMTVNPGYKGQPLVPQTLNKIYKLDELLKMGIREKVYRSMAMLIQTIPDMILKGADNLILGSSSLFDKKIL